MEFLEELRSHSRRNFIDISGGTPESERRFEELQDKIKRNLPDEVRKNFLKLFKKILVEFRRKSRGIAGETF